MKIKRDAFIYLEPKGQVPENDFAQCAGCMMFSGTTGRWARLCGIHGKRRRILPTMSCDFYVEHEPDPKHGEMAMPLVTPEESGLVDRKVRCENCAYGNKKRLKCELYLLLNALAPAHFDLDPNIKPKACCNANTERKQASVGNLAEAARRRALG